jgi:hypothetical protein
MRLLLAALCIGACTSTAPAQSQSEEKQPTDSQHSTGRVTSSDENKGQSQPQGKTGPITTGSGGTSAASPQGDTPPDMQVAPEGSKQKMSDHDKEMAADTLRTLHGARSLPPLQAAEALQPFLEAMKGKKSTGDKLADASAEAVMALARNLETNQAASDDLWQEAIEATLSYANEVG